MKVINHQVGSHVRTWGWVNRNLPRLNLMSAFLQRSLNGVSGNNEKREIVTCSRHRHSSCECAVWISIHLKVNALWSLLSDSTLDRWDNVNSSLIEINYSLQLLNLEKIRDPFLEDANIKRVWGGDTVDLAWLATGKEPSCLESRNPTWTGCEFVASCGLWMLSLVRVQYDIPQVLIDKWLARLKVVSLNVIVDAALFSCRQRWFASSLIIGCIVDATCLGSLNTLEQGGVLDCILLCNGADLGACCLCIETFWDDTIPINLGVLVCFVLSHFAKSVRGLCFEFEWERFGHCSESDGGGIGTGRRERSEMQSWIWDEWFVFVVLFLSCFCFWPQIQRVMIASG